MSSRPFLVCLCCLLQMSAAALAQDRRLDRLSDCNTLAQSALQWPVCRSSHSSRKELEERFDNRAFRKYRDNYDLSQAYRCKRAVTGYPSPNRDASASPNSLFPPALTSIAKSRIGFVHGFDSVDPDLALSGSALEISDITQNKSGQTFRGMAGSADSVGEWKFDLNDIPTESQRVFARPFEQASGERIGVRLRLITISTIHSSNTTFQDRESDLERWQKVIADNLTGESFRSLTPTELAGTPFRNADALRDFLVKNMSYGNRDFVRRTFGPHVVFLVNEEDGDCNKVAEAFVAEPREEMKNDHGVIGLNVFTIGRCRGDGGPDEVLDQIIRQETEILENEVRRP